LGILNADEPPLAKVSMTGLSLGEFVACFEKFSRPTLRETLMRLASKMIRRTAVVLLLAAVTGGVVFAANNLYECQWCKQQYQGSSPPAFVKCPAKDFKQNHFWIKK
ncbi:MAG: hypothetical protein DWH98_08300, partial [Planctomycetota bacterium]